MSAPFLSIIIPAYNEEKRLPRTLESIFNFLKERGFSFEVIVVENGSTDATYRVACDFQSLHSNVFVLQSERGKGNAVRLGALSARGEYRFICDADLSMPIEEVLNFIPPQLDGFDVAIASREAPGAVRFNEPYYRHAGGRVINFIIRLLILPGLHDTQCGFKCFRAESVPLLFEKQTLPGWSFDIEILYLARRNKLRIREIPIHWYFDEDTKVNALPDAIGMLADIFKIHVNAWNGKYGPKP